MKNKMDKMTNLRSLQSNEEDRREPRTCTNGGKYYEVRVREMTKENNRRVILRRGWSEKAFDILIYL